MTSEHERPILIICPESAEAATVRSMLTEAAYGNVHIVDSGREALRILGVPYGDECRAEGTAFELLIVADGLQDVSTLAVCQQVNRQLSAFLPILLIGKPASTEERVKWIDAGIGDFLDRPVVSGELLARVGLNLRKHQHVHDVNETTKRIDVTPFRQRGRLPVIGDRIGDFVVDDAISATGSTHVFKVHDLNTAEIRVLKMLVVGDDRDHSLRTRFEREAAIITDLEDPNVIRVMAHGQHEGHPYIVMEYVDGADLHQLLRSESQIPFATIFSIAEELARALQAIHEIGIIHRDIKPQNVFRTASGKIKLADFGISIQIADTRLTEVGFAVGTPLYMAPEQVEYGEIGPTTDIYSYGATIYQLISGRPPFPGKNAMKIIRQHLYDTPPPLRSLRAGVSEGWEAFVCEQCLAKQPAERPQTMAQVLTALSSLRDQPF